MTVHREPVLDRDTVDVLRALILASDTIREQGISVPFQACITLNWAADKAGDIVRNWEHWIEEHGA